MAPFVLGDPVLWLMDTGSSSPIFWVKIPNPIRHSEFVIYVTIGDIQGVNKLACDGWETALTPRTNATEKTDESSIHKTHMDFFGWRVLQAVHAIWDLYCCKAYSLQ
eukprot:697810-Amorphochlora_amoeboformis.AAC.1